MGRVLDVDYLDREKATKFFKEWRPDDEDVKEDNKALFSLADVVEREPELTALRDKSELHKQWFDYANKLQGMKRNASQHASGVAIASDDLMALGVPLMASYNKQRDQTIITTQFDMDELAKLGIPKFDQLKLSSLNTIAETERLIGADFSIEEVPLDDRLTFRSLSLGDNLGVFQVAQPKVRQVMKAVRPQTLEDLAAVITIIRPGLFAKDEETGYTMEELYKARRQGSVPVKYFAPFLEPITKNSQGIMIYQEHVLKVLWDSGMDPLEADKLRKILSKKQMSKAKEYEERFIAGIQERQGLTAEQATQLWAMVVEFAAYGFNAAHAYAYGLIAYWTSYLKTHHPAQFMAATLTVQSQKSSKAARELIPKLLEDCSQMGRGLEVLPPNVNRSNRGFSIELKPTDSGLVEAIRFGLGGIKGVGSLADHIIEERMAGEFLDFEDFDRRLGVRLGQRPNKTALTALAYAGAFDDWFSHRSKAVWAIDVAREDVKYKREALLQDGFTAEKAASLAQKQAELCGNFYFVRDNLEVLGTDKVDNFFEKSRKEKVTIGGRVIECKLDRKSRSGKAYHRAVVKTQWGDVTVDFYGGWNDPTKHLAEIKEKLFAGSVIIVQGDVGGENLLFGRTIRLPRKQFQGELREDPTALKREAETFLLSSA
jgi:DNA polymerase-3 subunit alpha